MFRKTNFYIFLKNCLTVINWFIFKSFNTKVVFFSVPSSVILTHSDYSIPETVDNRLKQLESTNYSTLSTEQIFEDSNNDNLKKLLKISWLIESLRKDGNINPVQLLMSADNKYFCHPGTDRLLVMSYIDPVETISGFYIWYQDLDPKPFILDYQHQIVNNPFTFISKFKFNKHLYFKQVKMEKDLDVSDKVNSNAMFHTAKLCFDKVGKDYSVNFLSYYDSTQWSELKNNFDINKYIAVSKNKIELSNIKFKKVKGKWLPDYDQH
jgi:hypothetical protein